MFTLGQSDWYTSHLGLGRNEEASPENHELASNAYLIKISGRGISPIAKPLTRGRKTPRPDYVLQIQ